MFNVTKMASRPTGSVKKQQGKKKVKGGGKAGNSPKAVRPFDVLSLWTCVKCSKNCDEDEDSIECSCCGQWCHQGCADIADDIFSELSKPNLRWVCSKCVEEEAEPKAKNDTLMREMLKLISKLTDKIDRLDAKLQADSHAEDKIVEIVQRQVSEALEEEREREKRKRNIIIVNLSESSKTSVQEKKEDDLKQSKKLIEQVTEVTETDLSYPVRLGREGGNRPRMLKITVSSEKKKKEILKNAAKLNEGKRDQAKKVYINADYTPKEREMYKALRAEKREREEKGERDLVIRNGRVVAKSELYKSEHRADKDLGKERKINADSTDQ